MSPTNARIFLGQHVHKRGIEDRVSEQFITHRHHIFDNCLRQSL